VQLDRWHKFTWRVREGQSRKELAGATRIRRVPRRLWRRDLRARIVPSFTRFPLFFFLPPAPYPPFLYAAAFAKILNCIAWHSTNIFMLLEYSWDRVCIRVTLLILPIDDLNIIFKVAVRLKLFI
jgi:hypothetical protein